MKPVLFIHLLLALSLISSCHKNPQGSKFKNEIIIASGYPIGKIDPFTSGRGIGANLNDLIYRPLFRVGPNNDVIPDYAKSAVWKNQRTVLELTLLPSQINDVIKTIRNSTKNRESGYAPLLKNLESLEQVSENKLILKFKKYDQGIIYILSNLPIVEYSQSNFETGPFRIDEQNGTTVILKRQSPANNKLNKITFKNYASTRLALRDFVAGKVDFIISADETDFEILENLAEIDIAYLNTNLLYKLLKGSKYPKLEDPVTWSKLQKILVERNLFADTENRIVSAYLPIPKSLPWYQDVEAFARPDIQTNNFIQSSISKSLPLHYLDAQAKDHKNALILKRFLESVGYKINLSGLDTNDFKNKIFSEKNFSLALIPFTVKDPIISNYVVFHTPDEEESLNISGYSNPKLDTLLEKARYNPDPEESKQAFFLAMQELMKEPPALFLFWVRTPLVYRKSCQGFSLDADKFFSSLKDVSCEL